MKNQQPAPQQQGGFIVGGNEGSFVSGESLKQVDVPIETLLGVVNGSFKGALLSSAISAVVTAAQSDKIDGEIWKEMAKGLGKHLPYIAAGTVAVGALGGIIRHSRASMHNKWSDQHYAYLQQQTSQHQSFSERIDAQRTAPSSGEPQR